MRVGGGVAADFNAGDGVGVREHGTTGGEDVRQSADFAVFSGN